MAYVIAEPCIGTKDVGCVDVCPVEAIFPQDEVPDKWKDYIDIDAQYYRM